MSDRVFFASAGLAAMLMIVLAAVWPQGYGDRSPGPFGHTPLQRTPAMQAALAREAVAGRGPAQAAKTQALTAGLRPDQ
jgi:hypothetical protein